MNKLSKILALSFILSGIVFLNGCVKEKFDAPANKTPSAGITANTTIAAFNQLYADSFSPGYGKITQDIIIQGVVVANDQSGNIYKNIYIEDGTGGLDIAINQSGLYTSYRVGQKLLIKCQGLYLGNYGGVPELGFTQNGAIYFMPAIFMKDHIFLDSLPKNPPAPTIVTIPLLATGELSTLVRIDSVYFSSGDVGQVFGIPTSTATNRTFNDKNGNMLVIRTSNYANFAGKHVPNGYGSVVGILGSYNGSYQFTLRDSTDLIGFGGAPPFLLNEGFATSGSLDLFTQYSVTGTEIWVQYVTPGSVPCAKMSGYTGANHANVDWLISPALDLSQYTNCILKFQSGMKYGSTGDGSLKIMVSTDYSSGDPTSATWTEVTGAALPTGADWNFVNSGDLSLAAFNGSNTHIGFKYTSTTSSAATWEITNIILKGTHN